MRECSGSGNVRLDEAARLWGGGGWRRYFFPAFWLVYLGQAVDGVSKHAHGAAAVAGYLIVVAFAACYLIALPMGWEQRSRAFWPFYAACLALTALETPFAHFDALVFLVYIAVLTVAARGRWTFPAVIVLVLIMGLAPVVMPSGSGSFDWNGALTVFLVAFAMFGFFRIIQSNVALTAARAEVARLAAENERSRIARDLHDLLGHSLTTITVKAGLARRLAERGEQERALAEISEVEQLSRRTLGDVRAAVAGHREVTLAGELATAREVLRAAGIIAELPGSVDMIDPELSEVFGWVVREGVTNVVRHSRAEHVRITLGRRWVEVSDDGKGVVGASAGNGISGLRERLSAVGGTLLATGGLTGFRLRAEVPPGAGIASGVEAERIQAGSRSGGLAGVPTGRVRP